MLPDEHARRRFKRPLLYVLVGSVILGAIVGIGVVVRGEWGWFEVRVVLTTITLAVASLCGLACDLSRRPWATNLLPALGFALTLLAATLILIGMWSDYSQNWFWKATFVASAGAIATVHVCLLSIAQLVGRLKWVFYGASQIIYGLACLLSFIVMMEVDEADVFRLVAALAILATALTLIIPLLSRMGPVAGKASPSAAPLVQRSMSAIDGEIEQLQSRIVALEKLKAELQSEVSQAGS